MTDPNTGTISLLTDFMIVNQWTESTKCKEDLDLLKIGEDTTGDHTIVSIQHIDGDLTVEIEEYVQTEITEGRLEGTPEVIQEPETMVHQNIMTDKNMIEANQGTTILLLVTTTVTIMTGSTIGKYYYTRQLIFS